MPISIDIDGVIAKLPRITNVFKGKTDKHTDLFVNSRMRQLLHKRYISYMNLTPYSTHALKTLFDNNFKVLLNSARPVYLSKDTQKWLERNSILKFIEHTHLRETGLDIVRSKADLIEKHNVKIHIDDNPYIVEKLSGLVNLNRIYFVTNDNKVASMFSNNKKVRCVTSLSDATKDIITNSPIVI